jgi:hypothetical protein
MWRILQCYNFLIEGQVWGSSVHAQIHWFSRDDDNAEKNFRCAKFCNATVFSLKVALVIHLHTQMEWFFRNAGTSKVENSLLLQISSSKVALVIICVYQHGVIFWICLMMQRRTSWFCKEMCTTFSCFFVKHCSHLAWQVLSFIFLIQSESHCAMFTDSSNVGLLCL